MFFMWTFLMSNLRIYLMLKYILCLLFTLNATFSYGVEDMFDAVSKRTRQQEFFTDQNN